VADYEQNARTYWEMFGGVNLESQDNLYVRFVDIDLEMGGYFASQYPYYQVSVYGRRFLDGPNLETIYRSDVVGLSVSPYFVEVAIREAVVSTEVRCIVVKLERKPGTFAEPTADPPLFFHEDQHPEADPPPWGIRIKAAHVYGSPLGRNIRPDLVFADILDNADFTYSGPVATWTADQLAYVDIPNDRWDALDEFNGMLGWNYACWDGETVEFSEPRSGTAHEIAADDARTTWSVSESLDETYNAVRVCYGNKRGKLREVIVHGDTSAIGFVRADTLHAPESIRSEKAAIRFGNRYLRAHEKKQVAGTVTVRGDDGTLDALLVRPGDTVKMTGPAKLLSGTHEVSHVTLHVLDWAADVQFGTNSKRFDLWLARLAAGAKSIKRR